jgi:DNA polymerase-3 subunit gamma/tau
LSFRERHAAQFEAGRRAKQQNSITAPEVEEPTEFVPSDEDTALEETVLMGQKAIEQILGGKVIEETSNF